MAGNESIAELLTKQWTIEEQFDPLLWQQWMGREGMMMWVACTALYLVMIFKGPRFMEGRPKYEVRAALLLWNAALAVHSIISAWRLTIAARDLVFSADSIHDNGVWHALVCGADFYTRGGYSAFWLFLFALSKLFEYGDTVFIVLRKGKLILLHWLHHMLTFLVGFHTFAYSNPTLFISALMNVYVHSLMYTYYLLRIAGVRVPKPLAMMLTTIQIVQLMIGTYAQFYAMWIYLIGGGSCELGPFAVYVGTFGYAAICLLFIDFFIKTYIRKGRDKSKIETDKKET